ncbi:MAG TPA: helix-turn-helix domain-containing protein [Pseudonocardiaceae bacterium]|nr:helix-turn-helix domain-containing protein [Pseudonocardiaceae bacterium]
MLESSAAGDQRPPLRPELATYLRPELTSLADEIIAEIRRAIPEYARPLDSPYGHALRVGVEQAIGAFVDQVANPVAPPDRRDDICRRLGRLEAEEGRSLDSLQAAYRVGSRVAWQRVMRVGQRNNFSSAVMSLLADALLAYVDELASLSLDGYQEAKARNAELRQEQRRRLLHLILRRPYAPQDVASFAAIAGWEVPAEATMVALPSDVDSVKSLPNEEIIADLTETQPYLLVPGPLDAERRAGLAAAFPRMAVAVTVPLAQAADALRWARRALDLARAGLLGDDRVTLCENHLATLFLLSDNVLIDQIASRQFALLAQLTPRQRRRVVETMEVWLDTRGSATEMAERLHVHPQTVRHRMRQIEKIFTDELDQPQARFTIELVLRVYRLRGVDELYRA